MSASELSPECRGFIAAQPNHQLYNQAERPFLQLAVSADPYDTTLVVGLPDGSFRCNDDADGLNPAVLLGPAPAGSLRIWVGSYSPGESGEYRLAVTTDPRARAGGVGPDAPD